MKVIVVEDESIVNLEISTNLKKIGYDVIDTTYSGEEALSTMEINVPDVIILDILMGKNNLNGIEIAKIINYKYPNVKIIFSTGSNVEYKKFDGINYSGILTKPYRKEELYNMLNKIIGVEA